MYASGTTRAFCAMLAVVVASWGTIGCACSCAKPSAGLRSQQESCCSAEERGSTDAATVATPDPQPCHSATPTDTPGKCDCPGCSTAVVGTCESQSVTSLVPAAKRVVSGTQVALATPAVPVAQPSWQAGSVFTTGPPGPSGADSLFSLHCLLTT